MTGCWKQGGKQEAVAACLLSTGQREIGQCCSLSNTQMQTLGKSHGSISTLCCSLLTGRGSDPKFKTPRIMTFNFECYVLKTHKLDKTFHNRKKNQNKTKINQPTNNNNNKKKQRMLVCLIQICGFLWFLEYWPITCLNLISRGKEDDEKCLPWTDWHFC